VSTAAREQASPRAGFKQTLASFFPSIGAVNPSLTAMANALRVGDHLLERTGTSPGVT